MVWHSGLTKKSADIERVQRIAIGVILDKAVLHYAQDCAMIGLKPLDIRREELCEQMDMFKLLWDGSHNTRSNDDDYRENICKKSRFFNSPLPYLTRLLNR